MPLTRNGLFEEKIKEKAIYNSQEQQQQYRATVVIDRPLAMPAVSCHNRRRRPST